VRDLDTNMYERQDGQGLEIGSYAHRPMLDEPDEIPSIEEAALSPTELGEDRDRRQRSDPVVAHQRPAAGLALGIVAQLLVQRSELRVVGVDLGERDRDLLARCWRQLQPGEPGA
jgi:hypothetical protein